MTTAGVCKGRTGTQDARRPASPELYCQTQGFPEESRSDFYASLSLFCKREAKGEIESPTSSCLCLDLTIFTGKKESSTAY